MLTSEELANQSIQHLVSLDDVERRAVALRHQHFLSSLMASDSHLAVGLGAFIVGSGTFIGSAFILDSMIPTVTELVSVALLVAVMSAGFLCGYTFYTLLWKRVSASKEAQYLSRHPIDTEVRLSTQIRDVDGQTSVVTLLQCSGLKEQLEEVYLNLEDEQSIKAVARLRVRNEQSERLLNSWVNRDIEQLPPVEQRTLEAAQVEAPNQEMIRRQTIQRHKELAHSILTSADYDTKQTPLHKVGQ